MSTVASDAKRLHIVNEVNRQPLALFEFEPSGEGEFRIDSNLPVLFITRDEAEALRDFINEYLRVA